MNRSIEWSPSGSPTASLPVRVTAVMPCLNEELTVGMCVKKAQRAFEIMGIPGEVVVADNGSTDRSIDIATALGARVVRVDRKGYGAALLAGFCAASGEFIVMGDSDDSYDWTAIRPFIEALESGADLVIGNRFAGGIETGAMPGLHRYLGNPLLSWLARKVHGAPIADFHCGMRGLRRSAIPQMDLRTSGMEFATEMIVNSVHAGLRILEVPTTLRKDGRDRPPHLRSFRDGWRHLRFILTYGPNHLFLGPGSVCFLLGGLMLMVLSSGPVTIVGHYFGIHFLALACALALVGFNVIQFGVLAKVTVLRRMPGSRSTLARWILLRFSLERSLIFGLLLFASGVVVDGWLTYRWLSGHGTPMDSTVHAAFIATLAIVLGVNSCFGAFLLQLLVSETRD